MARICARSSWPNSASGLMGGVMAGMTNMQQFLNTTNEYENSRFGRYGNSTIK